MEIEIEIEDSHSNYYRGSLQVDNRWHVFLLKSSALRLSS
jgi:hypothetical protein